MTCPTATANCWTTAPRTVPQRAQLWDSPGMPRGEPLTYVALRIRPADADAAQTIAGAEHTDRSAVLRRWITLGRLAEQNRPEEPPRTARSPQRQAHAPQTPPRTPAAVQPAHPVMMDPRQVRSISKAEQTGRRDR